MVQGTQQLRDELAEVQSELQSTLDCHRLATAEHEGELSLTVSA